MRSKTALLALLLVFSAGIVLAQADVFDWKVTVRGDSTDNRDATVKEISNFDLYVVPRMDVRISKENVNIECFYAPAYRYRSKPADTERENLVHHQAGLTAKKQLSKVSQIKFEDKLAFTDDPSLHKGGTTLRRDSSFLINRAEGSGKYILKDKSFVQGNASYFIKRYKEDTVADESDQDILGADVLLWKQFNPTMGGLCEIGGSMIDYDHTGNVIRDLDTVRVTAGMERLFSKNVRAGLRAGLMNVEYADKAISSEVVPFLTLGGQVSSAGSELGAGITYSTREADVFPYSSQESVDFYLKASREHSKLLSFGAVASVHLGTYDADKIPKAYRDEFTGTADYEAWLTANDIKVEGEEVSIVGQVWADYHVNPSTSIRVAQRIDDVDSEVSTDFTRNSTTVSVTKAF